MNIDFEITEKQEQFITANVDELLYGGAAGGGKSYVQLIDAYRYALQYPHSKQLILRRTFPDLERSLIRVSREMYSQDICRYNDSKHTYSFKNGSIVDFGYCDSENDVYMYQSAEYDVIRFDELTHFTEFMYLYLISRVRGTKPFPRCVKSTSNPGNVGHTFVRERFINIAPPNTVFEVKQGSKTQKRLFIPSKVQDNPFLMKNDPDYVVRLENLPDKEKKALLYGDWDIFEGQYFSEFDRNIHVIDPFLIPQHWRKYTSMDYGLDMLAHYWIAADTQGYIYVTNEIYESGLIVSEAVKKIQEREIWTGNIDRIAPPDLWNRQSLTGKSTALLFSENGFNLRQSNNDRVAGWYALKELLKVVETTDDEGNKLKTSKLKIFSNCKNLIRTLPAVQFDEKDPNDVAREPHELTHAPDAIRYFAISWTSKANEPEQPKPTKLIDVLRKNGVKKVC